MAENLRGKSADPLRPGTGETTGEPETERGKKSVTLIDRSNGTTVDAFGYLDPLSEFWELIPGNNRILYGSNGNIETGLYISYFERYAGV